MRVLLTSAGLETEKIKLHFEQMLNKDAGIVKALFIPVAAINVDAIEVLPKCMEDLLKCDILKTNITVYDLHECISSEEMKMFDIVYICGGQTEYLLERMNDTGFRQVLINYIRENGVVLGVSAGSLIFTNNLPGNLGLIDTKLDVHCEDGDEAGKVVMPVKANIRLTNERALAIYAASDMEIIG